MIEFQPSHCNKHSRTLEEITDVILRKVGYPQQCVGEVTPEDVREFVLDATGLVSQYKPRILEKTISASNSSGMIIATGVFYPSDWKVGDAEPDPVPRQDVICYLGVSPTQSVHKYNNSPFHTEIYNYGFGFPERANGGVVLENTRSLGSQNLSFHQFFDDYLDFHLLYQNVQAGISMSARVFEWQQNYSQKNIAYYANKPNHVTQLTIRVAIEHCIGGKYYVKPETEEEGTPVIEKEQSLSGTTLYYVQNLALSNVYKKIGMIRTKIQGGMNQFQLNGDTMLQEGQILEERMMEELKGSGGDHWGYFNDSF